MAGLPETSWMTRKTGLPGIGIVIAVYIGCQSPRPWTNRDQQCIGAKLFGITSCKFCLNWLRLAVIIKCTGFQCVLGHTADVTSLAMEWQPLQHLLSASWFMLNPSKLTQCDHCSDSTHSHSRLLDIHSDTCQLMATKSKFSVTTVRTTLL